MNILLLNYEYPPIGGGAGNATYNYAREFVKLGHTVVVLTSAYKKIYEYSNENGVHLYRVPSLRKHQDRSNPFQMLAYNLSSIVFCKRIIKQYKIDKTIAFMSIPSGISAIVIKTLFNIPYLIFLGGGDVPGSQTNVDCMHKIVTPLRRAILKNASYIVAVSEGLANLSLKTDEYHVNVIPTGVDMKFFKPISKVITDDIIFLYVGRLSEEKNINLIIKQFKKVIDDGLKAKLHLVGNGPLYKSLFKLCEEFQLMSDIKFYNWVDKNSLLNIYQESDCLINASKGEGLSNTILEAMSCGLAILASDVTGNNDLIKHNLNGLLFSLDEENSLYYNMKKLVLDNCLMKHLKQKSRETVFQEYSWQISAEKYINLLLEI